MPAVNMCLECHKVFLILTFLFILIVEVKAILRLLHVLLQNNHRNVCKGTAKMFQNNFQCCVVRQIFSKTTVSCNSQLRIFSKFSLQQNQPSRHLNLITSHVSKYVKGDTKNQDNIRLVLKISSGLNGQEEYNQRCEQ